MEPAKDQLKMERMVVGKRSCKLIFHICMSLFFWGVMSEAGRGLYAEEAHMDEPVQYRLSQSSDALAIWTAPPTVKIFRDDPIPSEGASSIKLYAAGNEFEPFQVILMPDAFTTQVKISMVPFVKSEDVNALQNNNLSSLPTNIETEIYQVQYIQIDHPTDLLGRAGEWPDPLMPVERGEGITLFSNENNPFWITVHVADDTPPGDYTSKLHLNDVSVPVTLHVFNFSIPRELHVKSQMNFSHQTILESYGVECCGDDYWQYVDNIKAFFFEHRLTPKSVLWSGGVTSNGGRPYIDYDCNGTLTDNDGIWGFEAPALRYLDGTGMMSGTFSTPFNGNSEEIESFGFPSFMAATFRNNDPAQDQRPTEFCGIIRQGADWYEADNPLSSYNEKWFQYMAGLERYLDRLGYLDKAYHYMANEPQDQADYNAVAWYSRHLKAAAPNLKLMVSEEPKPEIFNHPDYIASGQIDIWLPVLNHFNPEISADRELNHGEETWIYWLHGTRPPFFNPITLDHPGIESKFTGWFLWKYRIRGIAYYALNNWGKNPWVDPMTSGHNGDTSMLYPPSQDNRPIVFGETNHRFVSSIRFELLRDGLEDYEYLYLLNGGNQPEPDPAQVQKSVGGSFHRTSNAKAANGEETADSLTGKIIQGVASYTRDDAYMYELRRLMGLKIGGEIDHIPVIRPRATHPRAEEAPGNYYINFQDPDGDPLTTKTEDRFGNGYIFKFAALFGHDYLQVGTAPYDDQAGFGWLDDTIHFKTGRDPWGEETDERKITYVYDDWAHHPSVFEFDLPSGDYEVEISVGTPRKVRAHNRVMIEGVNFIDDEASDPYIVRKKKVTVSDSKLTLDVGIFDEYTMLDYLNIEAVQSTDPATGPDDPSSENLLKPGDAEIGVDLNQSMFNAGDPLIFNLTVNTKNTALLDGSKKVDLYGVIILPDGFFLSFTALMPSPGFSSINALKPFASDQWLSADNYFSVIEMNLPQGLLPQGNYGFCGVITEVGANPWDFDRWVGYDCRFFEINSSQK